AGWPRCALQAAPRAGPRRRAPRSHGSPLARGDAQEPFSPRANPLTGLSTEDNRLDVGMDLIDVVEQLIQFEVQVREQVNLVHHDNVAGAKHQWVLERLVLALGHRA